MMNWKITLRIWGVLGLTLLTGALSAGFLYIRLNTVASAFCSGSCTRQIPCSVQAIPQRPIAVSNSAKSASVMTDILPRYAGRTSRILLSMDRVGP